MICPHCGAHRQLNEAMVGRIMTGGSIGGLCPECHHRYTITRNNAFDGDPEWEPITCKRCGARPAERGITICIDCWSFSRNKAEARRQREAVEKERAERSAHKPKESVDEIACKAQVMGLSYGKYQMLRYMGKIKEE